MDNTNGKYYGEWASHKDVRGDYPDAPDEADIIFAGYTYEDYSGDALVVFQKDGELYENNDGHCSCNGLEDWRPEQTSIGALRMRRGWPTLQAALTAFGLPLSVDAVDPAVGKGLK